MNLNYCEKINIICNYKSVCNSSFKNINDEHINKLKSANKQYLSFLLLEKRLVYKIEFVHIKNLNYIIEKYKKHKIFIYSQYGTLYPELYEDGYKFTVLISSKNKYLKHFLKYEFSHINDKVKCGIILGYPLCCVKFYSKYEFDKKNIHLDSRWKEIIFKDINKNKLCPLINKKFMLLDHIPCSYNCKQTIKNIQEILKYFELNLGIEYINSYFNYIK
jgi:hypothetical protein